MAEAILEAIPEAVHCPSCSTRYRLHSARVTPSIRRAKCFTCGGIFPVGDVVQRLLALPKKAQTGQFQIEDVHQRQRGPQAPLDPPLPPLDLGRLEDFEAELMEKTLIQTPEFLPEVKGGLNQPPPLPTPPRESTPLPPSLSEVTLSGYTSARDAIDKLFAGAPAVPTPSPVTPPSRDMEATLSALESTLGGGAHSHPTLGGSSSSGDAPPADEQTLGGPSSSTLRLSQRQIQDTLDSSDPSNLTVPQEDRTEVVPRSPAPPLSAQVPMPVPAPTPAPAPALASPALPPGPPEPEAAVEELRLKIGTEIYPGLTMAQLVTWVSEGRILENHLVARQHSDNWLEAHKVPGLRPAFEKLRRERSGGAPNLSSPSDEGASKKTLFGGLFGSN